MAVPTNKESTRFTSLKLRGSRSDSNTMGKVPLTIQAVVGQTANMMEIRDSGGNVVFYLDSTGAAPASLIQYATVPISAAQIIATTAGGLGHAAGLVLVADPVAGKVVELISATMSYTFGVAAYTAGGNLTVNSNGGAALTGLVSAANSLGAAASNITQFSGLAAAGNALTAAKGLNLVSSVAFTNPGTATGTVKVFIVYRVHTL